MSRPIEDYGLIGNMLSAALVARDGSIDWLCLPHFNSPACFASLLGDESNGHWRLSATDPACTITRRYVPKTAVLETRLHTATGIATVFDFMPLSEDEGHVDVVRLVRGDMGHVEMHTELVLRFNYGQAVPWVRRRDYGLSAVSGPDAVEMHTPIRLHGKDMKSEATFTVKAGELVPFTLSYHRSHQHPHFVPDRAESLQKTIDWWHHWASTCRVPTEDPTLEDAVVRSAITLKLLTFWPTGGIVAAPTTSLPEDLGGERNWDYRYCWLRDASLTLYALLNAGYRGEAEAWREWLLRAASGHPDQLHIMYGISGERWLPETVVPWLKGYENSRPVRIGNEAVNQLQLDVYGEVMGALHTSRAADLTPMREAWRLQRVMLRKLETIWDQPDNGIWEMRGPPRHFTYSRMMSWLAFDRAIQSAERFNLEGDLPRWHALRDQIHAEICERGFNAEMNSFTQSYGDTALDASLLLMVKTGFLPPDDARMTGTVAAIERELLRDGLVLRYATDDGSDGLEGDEGAFLACSFWLVDAYILQGRKQDARKLYDRLLSLRNDVGLLAEEYDTKAGRLVGNFPQAFSHVGLINTTYDLIDAHGPSRQEAESTAPSWADPQT